jgi:hypothetical protein
MNIRFTPNDEMRENNDLSHVVVRSSQQEGQELWGKVEARSGLAHFRCQARILRAHAHSQVGEASRCYNRPANLRPTTITPTPTKYVYPPHRSSRTSARFRLEFSRRQHSSRIPNTNIRPHRWLPQRSTSRSSRSAPRSSSVTRVTASSALVRAGGSPRVSTMPSGDASEARPLCPRCV